MTAPTAVPTPGPTPATPGGWHVEVPLVGPVGWPPTGSLAFLGVMGVFVAFEVLAWPVAAVLALGHVLARDHDSPLLEEVGAGLEAV